MGGVDVPFVVTEPTAAGIVAGIELAVAKGRLLPGATVPSVRALASVIHLSPATVAAAYKVLRNRGVLTSSAGSRTRVSPRPPLTGRSLTPLPAGVRDVASGNPDPEFLPSLPEVAARLHRRHYLYTDATVLPELLEMAVHELHPLQVSRGQICLAGGAMDALERVLSAYLKPGDQVAVEDPGYTGVLDLLRAMGFVPVGVPIDDAGMLPDELAATLARPIAACIITPRAQNPMGSAIDAVRGAELAAVLAAHPDLLVVEDDHASGAVDAPYVSVLGDRPHWALIRSMSKSLGPDLRIAMIGADPTTASRVEGRQQVGTGWVSHLIQELTVQLWREKDTADRLRGAQRAYSKRREAFLTELASRGVPARGRSGLNVYVPVPEEVPVVRQLFDRGWAVQAGEPYRLASRPFIRVTTAALDPSDGAELAGHIAAALHATVPARVSRAG